MAMEYTLVSIRVLHILAATIWVGGNIVVAGFVVPAIRSAGPAGPAVMRQLTTAR